MKRCPSCNNTFDDRESYCTYDGATLLREDFSPSLESQPTANLGEPRPTVSMPSQRATGYAQGAPANAPSPPKPYSWANEEPLPPAPVSFSRRTAAQQQTMAVLSLIFGLVGITFGWICGGPIFGLLALILGGIALKQITRNPVQYGGKPLALAGLITGGIVLLVHLAIIFIWIVMSIISAVSR